MPSDANEADAAPHATLRILPRAPETDVREAPLRPGRTILDTLLDASIHIRYACMMADCGQDLIRIVSGAELLVDPDADEIHTLNCMEAAKCSRLACQCELKPDIDDGVNEIERLDI
jgi:ferredoxin